MNAILATMRRSLRQLTSRRIYIVAMILVPLGVAWFFLDLMSVGLPVPVPAAVVDMDGSPLSRKVVRNLEATQFVKIIDQPLDYHEAMALVKEGKIYGFFYIPPRFQQRALSGSDPRLVLYSNMSIFVPGTFAFKGFKTTAVTTKGGLVMTTMVTTGLKTESEAAEAVQPVVIESFMPGNPWMNYSIYLCNSFVPGVLALMVMLITVASICQEIKMGTSVEWLRTARGSMFLALVGKLLPQTVIFSLVGFAIQAMIFGYSHFPMHGPLSHMLLAMVLLVVASQALAVTVVEILPNLRFGLSVVSLLGVLSFSLAGFSFPVEQMYSWMQILSYILPIRFYFLIYIDQALNGIPLYFSRFYYIALLVFLLVPFLGLRRLRKRMSNPVYVP